MKMQSKQCSRCNKVKPLSKFYKHKGTSFGVSTLCKKCQMKAAKLRYENKKAGKYYVYLLPEEHYCGQTKNLTWRKSHHKCNNRHIQDIDVVMSFDTRKEAKLMEAHFHALGWYGKEFKDPAYCLKTRSYV